MAAESWTIQRCLDWTTGYFERRGLERPRLNAEWLLTSVAGLSRTELYMNFDRPLSAQELASMHSAVERRAAGEPLQYITEEAAFRTITLRCEPGVLIPRPETELLVETVLEFLDAQVLDASALSAHPRHELPWNDEVERLRAVEQEGAGASDGAEQAVEGQLSQQPLVNTCDTRRAQVLEVGCGTGCISLSLAVERPGLVRCVATDIDPCAVSLAHRNRDTLEVGADVVDIREGNLVTPLDRATEWGIFDVLVSNPPYIPHAVMKELPREVAAFEPHGALDGGADGLDVFRRLLRAAPYMVRQGGLFACELHETCLDAAAQMCRDAKMERVRIVNDLAGRPRIICAHISHACSAQDFEAAV